ncbi:MAG: Hsp20/alpha crystallin family protein [Nitrospina sp.]|nr:MAG: Hsp20/alpha crystallin family protein [Nitrospina sp.]TDJ57994.1 MAG: Hsp20/alpha crystallin family protein [Nitrospina sp.]
MNLVRYEPKTYLDRFFDTDRLFNDFWPRAPFEGQRSFGDALKVNIVENDDNYTLIAEVPGMTEKDIDLEIKEGRMTLKGQVEESQEKKEKYYRMREFSRRSFERSFRIGEGVDQDHISAKLDSGVLTVVLPKKEEAKPKVVNIEVSS